MTKIEGGYVCLFVCVFWEQNVHFVCMTCECACQNCNKTKLARCQPRASVNSFAVQFSSATEPLIVDVILQNFDLKVIFVLQIKLIFISTFTFWSNKMQLNWFWILYTESFLNEIGSWFNWSLFELFGRDRWSFLPVRSIYFMSVVQIDNLILLTM